MKIIHVGLAASSIEKADRFFIDILGLEKSEPKIIDKNLIHAIFGINSELFSVHYRDETIDYEILVHQGYIAQENQITHSCIKVTNLEDIVNMCRDAGLKVFQIPKNSKFVTFISDYDGNLFEIKE